MINKIKDITKILIVFLMGISLIIGATLAVFTSSSTNSMNYFTTGKVEISLDKPDGVKYFDVDNIAPGDSNFANVVVSNIGSVEVACSVRLITTGKLTEGNYPLQVSIYDSIGNEIIPNNTYINLQAGKSENLKVVWLFPLNAGNDYQNGTALITILINAENNAYQIVNLTNQEGNGLLGKYYDTITFSNLKLKRIDSTINFNWGTGSTTAEIPADYFGIEWVGQIKAEYSEKYTFYTVTDDGIRLWVNNILIIDNWTDHPKTENQGSIDLEANKRYNIKIQYYEKSVQALVSLLWSSKSQIKEVVPQMSLYTTDYTETYIRTSGKEVKFLFAPQAYMSEVQFVYSKNGGIIQIISMKKEYEGYSYILNGFSVGDTINYSYRYVIKGKKISTQTFTYKHTDVSIHGLVGLYYTGKNFDSLICTKIDYEINFNWGYNLSPIPVSAIGTDHYRIRWKGEIEPLYSEEYVFYTDTDDGVRLWINGKLVINNWTDHSETENAGNITLKAGEKYSIVMEYYENQGVSIAKLFWSSNSQQKQIVPKEQLFVVGF